MQPASSAEENAVCARRRQVAYNPPSQPEQDLKVMALCE